MAMDRPKDITGEMNRRREANVWRRQSSAIILIQRPIWWRVSINQPPEKLHHATPAEIDDDLVVLHAVTAFHKAEIPQKAIVTVAHPS
jgi:hypothetical protein